MSSELLLLLLLLLKKLTWIRGKVFFSILRSALLRLRGSRSIKRKATNVKDIDVDVELARSRV